jgi:hypothetical protein
MFHRSFPRRSISPLGARARRCIAFMRRSTPSTNLAQGSCTLSGKAGPSLARAAVSGEFNQSLQILLRRGLVNSSPKLRDVGPTSDEKAVCPPDQVGFRRLICLAALREGRGANKRNDRVPLRIRCRVWSATRRTGVSLKWEGSERN